MKKEIEQSIFIDDEEGFLVEVILYTDGTTEQIVYDECGNRI